MSTTNPPSPSPQNDADVQSALLKKALGFSVDVVKTYKLKRIDYHDGKKIKEVEELAQGVDQIFVPPDLAAQIFWLKNRLPLAWKEKVNPNDQLAAQSLLDNLLREFKDDVLKETN